MNPLVKGALGYLPGLLGYEIRQKQPEAAESVLARAPLGTVLDIGANIGQFAIGMRKANPDATIHSFEPIPNIEQRLREAFKGDGRFFSHRIAVSDVEGVAKFEVNKSSASSSLLSLGKVHKETYPYLSVVEEIEVPVTTLDRWAAGRQLINPLLVKLDIQGNELAALRGATAVLASADYVLSEVNFAAMYEGQPSFDDLYDVLTSAGFKFIDLFASKRDSKSLRCLFGDMLFAKE